MATTRIMTIHAGRNRSIAKALRDVTDYMKNPLKTENGELVSSFGCAAETADAEFLLAKSRYVALTGRAQRRDVLAYHARQSFPPGEVTPEQANAIGCELARRFTHGRHAFIVCTHTDRAHIHNHIVWNSTTLDRKGKWRNFFRSAYALRRVSDTLCVENGLSIIENPQPSPGRDYARHMFGDGKPMSFQNRLRDEIDATLEQKPATFEAFLSLMKAAGYTVNTSRRHITFLAPGQKQPSRMDTLGGEYTEAAVLERIEGRGAVLKTATAKVKRLALSNPNEPSLLVDIQQKLLQGKGEGYRRWATVFNLKQAAKTLIYLQEHGLDSYAELSESAKFVANNFHDLSARIRVLDDRLNANAELQKHIVNYAKTRAVYVAYRKAGYSKAFRAEHEAEILLHQAAKSEFDERGYGRKKRLPSVKQLRAEYAQVLEEKKKAYAEYRALKTETRAVLTAKANVDVLLGVDGRERGQERRSTEL
ncbi:MAG: relaxase/mobilization nuclease domain-containing protein [Oscillospiraceae bacterium]|jgi:hypothetical protein|nr:relaxase/mobilization nuclease domain-containing protein [Oscillospiraceae bacterium]